MIMQDFQYLKMQSKPSRTMFWGYRLQSGKSVLQIGSKQKCIELEGEHFDKECKHLYRKKRFVFHWFSKNLKRQPS